MRSAKDPATESVIARVVEADGDVDTRGLEVVRVLTERGWIAPPPMHRITTRTSPTETLPRGREPREMLDGEDRILLLADSAEHVLSGHDPAVSSRYTAQSDDVSDVIALHKGPRLAGPAA